MTAEREGLAEIAGVLAEHEYALQLPRGAICTCGHVPTVDAASLKTQQDYHRNHLADLLAARDRRVRAEALREAQQVIAGEDTIEWARGAHSSYVSQSWAMGLLDDLLDDEADQ